MRSWKTKMKEWGFNKNIPGQEKTFIVDKERKRKLEGKDTSFFYTDIKVEPDKIKNWKKRRTTKPPSYVGEYFCTHICLLLSNKL